jgi:WD40 repeat protein
VLIVGYDAFISYGHSVDARLAPAIQKGLQRLAKPWYRPRALRVFRDETSLSTNTHLWSSIQAALDDSRWFILLASPNAVASPWVDRELEHWLATESVDRLLCVVTDGEWVWDGAHQDFDTDHASAVPAALRGALRDEPRHLDLRWARGDANLELRNPRFRDAIADLAAPIHGIAKDDLEGEDVRQHHRTRRVAGAAITGLAVLLVLAVAAGGFALNQRDDARTQATVAEARGLSALAIANASTEPDLALLLAVEAHRLDDTFETRNGLVTALAANPSLVGFRHELGDDVSGAVPSPDERFLVTGHANGAIRIWDRATMRLRTTIERAHQGPVASLVFSPDSSLIVSGSFDGTLRAWRTLTGKAASDVLQGDANGVAGVAFNPDGTQLVATGYDGTVRRWAFPEARPLGTTQVVAGFTFQPVFTPDGRSIVVGANDDTVRFVDSESGILTDARIDATRAYVLAVSSDGAVLATGGEDAVRLFDLPTGTPHGDVLRGARGGVTSVAFSADETRVAAAGVAGEVLVWDIASGALVRPALRGHTGAVLASWFNGINRVESVSATEFAVWDLGERATLGTTIPAGPIGVARRSGGVVALTGPNGSVHLVDARTGRENRRVASGIAAYIATLSPDASKVALVERFDKPRQADTPARIVVWSLRSSRKLADLRTKSLVNDLQFSPNGRTLAIAEYSGDVELLSVASGRAIVPAISATRQGGTFAVAFSPDGRRLATGGFEGKARLWNARTGQRISSIGSTHLSGVEDVAFDPAGQLVAVASSDGQLVLADARSGKVLGRPLVLTGTTRWVRVAFSGDSRLLAASTAGGAVVVWDVTRRLPVGTALGNQDSSRGLAFADRDKILVTGAVDSTGMRQLEPRAWERHACAIAGRNLTRVEWRQFLGDVDYRETCPARRSAALFGATDPAAFFAPIPGYTYGPPFDAARLRAAGVMQGRTITNDDTGEQAAVGVTGPGGRIDDQFSACFPPDPCVLGGGGSTPAELAGESVSTFLYQGVLPGVIWRPRPYQLQVFVVGTTQEVVNDIMTKVIRTKRSR